MTIDQHAHTDPATAAVRQYLEFLADPASARDNDLIARLEAAAASESDIVERLRLLSELERAKSVDGTALLDSFVRHAYDWALRNAITVGALKAVGVSPVVLAQAGFDLGHGSIHDRKSKSSKTRAAGSRERAPRTTHGSSGSVKGWASSQTGAFTIAEAMAGAGSSMMTVKKALTEMVEAGTVRSVGHIARPGVRGRAPEHFTAV